MKKVKYLAMLLAAGMFAACSDNLEDTGAGNAGGTTPATGEGYVKVAVNMPTTSGGISRADDDGTNTDDNDVILDDGVADEYAVEDGIIVFFKLAKDKTNPDTEATFAGAYNLGALTPQDGERPQVTEHYTIVTEAPMVNTDDGEKLYALVILNKPSNVTVDANHNLTIQKLAPQISTSSTLVDFTKALEDQLLETYTGNNYNKFTMTNSPLSNRAGTDDNTLTDNTSNAPALAASTLVEVNVYPLESVASAATPNRIYVERVAAKVTLNIASSILDTNGGQENDPVGKRINVTAQEGSVYSGDIVVLEGWALNVTNKSTSLVRNVDGFGTASGNWMEIPTGITNNITRFVGTEVIPMDYTSQNNKFRIYWAKDGNYASGDNTAGDFNIFYTNSEGNIVDGDGTNITESIEWEPNTYNDATETDDHALYCLENTMNYDIQNNGYSTTVVLKTQYLTKFGNQANPSAQHFFICGTNETKYPANEDIETVNGETGTTVESILDYVKDAANDLLGEENAAKIDDSDISLRELNSVNGGTYGLHEDDNNLIDLESLFNFTDNTNKEVQKQAIWNAVGPIKFYKGGVAYYYDDLYIRHFSDTETPWVAGETKGIQHLGRYGVVRNNWYEINITRISGPGEPGIDKPDVNNPNDGEEGYIRAEINVLSWAKRSQNVEL